MFPVRQTGSYLDQLLGMAPTEATSTQCGGGRASTAEPDSQHDGISPSNRG